MSEKNWTAGPWSTEYRKTALGGYAQEIFAADGGLIATAAWHPVKLSDTTTTTDREANARLIAAAPDRYDALSEMTDLAAGPIGGVTVEAKRAILAKARAALEKARGAA